ncbi:MAG: hypothetical protein QXE75_04430 [Sulfolobales archaeon]
MRIAVLVLVLAVSLFLVLDMPIPRVQASTTVAGVVNYDSVLLVLDNIGTVIGSYPTELEISFEYTRFYMEYSNEMIVKYRVRNYYAQWWPDIPAGMFYVPDVDGIFKIELKDKYIQVKELSTTNYEGVVVEISLKVSVDIVRLGVGNISVLHLGNYVLQYVLNGYNPRIFYEVEVEKVVGNQTLTQLYRDTVEFDLSQVKVSTYILWIWVDEINLDEYIPQGNLTSGGIVFRPAYTIKVCGKLSKTYPIAMSMIVGVSDREATLKVRSRAESCTTLHNVSLTPGINQTITLIVKSGAFSMSLSYEGINIEGLIVSISSPFGRVFASGSSWTVVLQSIVFVSGYYGTFPLIRVEGSASNEIFGSIDCRSLTISGEDVYNLVCEKTVYRDLNPEDIENSKFSFTVVYFDEKGKVWRYSAEVRLFIMDLSTITGQVTSIYAMSMNTVLIGVVIVLVIYIISYIKEMITSIPLFDTYLLRGALLTLVVAYAILSVGIPLVYYIFGRIIENMPLLNKYVSIKATDFRSAFGEMVNYYDQLFNMIMRDYENEFIHSIGMIMVWVQATTAVAMGLIAVALSLSTIWTPGAGIPFSSLASGMISVSFGIVSMIMMQTQMGVYALVAVTVSRIMVIVVTAVILTLMTIGVALMCVPTPMTQRIGEDLFGAGLIYMIVFPLIAPLSYSIYMHLMDVVRNQGALDIVGNICVYIPIPVCIIGFIPFMLRMVAFVVASGVATMLILGTLGYILSRTGVATGIGEALSSLVWRG